MEAIREEIRNNTTLNHLGQLKLCILESAKNIKSNDSTFGLSTLSTARDQLTAQMKSYTDMVQRVVAYQKAFISIDEVLEEGGQNDLAKLTEMIEKKIEEFLQEATEDVESQQQLDKIILEEEVQLETARQIPKDPITKKDIKVAVRSTVCNHIYDKEGIEDYFKQKEIAKKTKIQCPQAGCTNKTMSRKELVLDEETNKLIESL